VIRPNHPTKDSGAEKQIRTEGQCRPQNHQADASSSKPHRCWETKNGFAIIWETNENWLVVSTNPSGKI